MRYSAWETLRSALSGDRRWPAAWRDPTPKLAYQAVVVGGGVHGLATAYYLAKNHGLTEVAVLEAGWLGAGDGGHETAVVRADPTLPGNSEFHALGLRLWEGLSRELNDNVMFSPRGHLTLAHSEAESEVLARQGNAIRFQGDDADLLDRDAVRQIAPFLNFEDARFPIHGGLLQARAGVAHRDAVAWGYARAADRRGVDVIQNCEVSGFRIEGGRVLGVETTRGHIAAGRVGIAVAGGMSRLGQMAGLSLPMEGKVLRTFETEALKPVLPGVISFCRGRFSISQSNGGGLLFGGSLDGHGSPAARSDLGAVERVTEAAMALMPMIGQARVLRSWEGIVDVTNDGAPIIDRTPVAGLYLDGGWGEGGFDAAPASGLCFAHLIARDTTHPAAAHYRLERSAPGPVPDEEETGAQLRGAAR